MLSDSAFRIAFPGAMANLDAFMRGFVGRLHEHGVPQEKAATVLELAADLALSEKPAFNVGFAEKFADVQVRAKKLPKRLRLELNKEQEREYNAARNAGLDSCGAVAEKETPNAQR